MRIVIANAFSTNMLSSQITTLTFEKMSLKEAKKQITEAVEKGSSILSVIGHDGTAKVLTSILGIPVAYNRIEYKLQEGDIIFVFSLNRRLLEPAIDIKSITEDDIAVTKVIA